MHKKPSQHKKTGTRFDRKRTAVDKKPSSINELLAKRPLFQTLAATLAPQQAWQQWMTRNLPADLAAHLVNVVVKPAELVVYVDSAAWASHLRYGLAALDSAIRERDSAIVRCVVRVQPRQAAPASVT